MECGARLREDTTDPLYAEGSDREVYPEIARANLLRMKGEYEAAVEVCLGILRRYPSNETAHALLGDIYADQGKLADAIQWYELLVDLAPTSAVYRAKLENLRALQAAQQAQPVMPSPAMPANAEPVRPSTLRVWVYALFGLLILILVAAAFVAGQRMSSASLEPSRASAASSGGIQPPRTAPDATSRLPSIPPPPAEPSDTQGSHEPSSAPLPFCGMGETEEQLSRAISQQLGGQAVACFFDPLLNRWTVRTRIQAGALTRARVMQQALLVAAATFAQAPSLQNATFIVLVPGTAGSDTALFSAEISRAMLPPDVRTLTDAQIETLFQSTRVWWNPAVPLTPANPAGQAQAPSNPFSQ